MKFNDELKEPTMTYYDRLQEEIKRANKEAYKEGFKEGMQIILAQCIYHLFPDAPKSLGAKIRCIHELKHLEALLKDALTSASLATFENAVDATLQRQVQAM
jgi:hypothetical protein